MLEMEEIGKLTRNGWHECTEALAEWNVVFVVVVIVIVVVDDKQQRY